MVGACRNMGPHHTLRVAVAGAGLNFLPLVGIGVVAGPNLRHIAQHAKVKPVATRRAAFKQHVGAGCRHPRKHVVQPLHIPVRKPALLVERGRVQVGQRAVHIPFHIANRRALYRLYDLLHDVIAHFGPAQVQHQLVAPAGGRNPRHRDSPIRVGTVKVRILVYHLRLHPQAKLHAQRVDLLRKPRKALRQLFGVDRVIAKARFVAVARAKPAVVQHKQLNTQRRGFARQL